MKPQASRRKSAPIPSKSELKRILESARNRPLDEDSYQKLKAALFPESEGLPRGVYEKKPGSGDYWVRFADANGVIRRQHFGPSLAEAKRFVEKQRTEVRMGRFDPESLGRRKPAMTVAEMFEHYRPLRLNVRNKSEDARYADYWTDRFGKLELDALTPAELEKWRIERIQEVKPATVNRAITYLKAYYNLALRDERCKTNPAKKLKPLRENNERHRWLHEDEEERLKPSMDLVEWKALKPNLTAAEWERARPTMSLADWDLVAFAFHTGLRQEEQFGLRWEYVDLRRAVMKIPETKAGKHRFAQLNPAAIDILERQKRLHGGKSDWVFPGVKNPNVSRDANNYVNRVFKPALKRAGIRDFHWHDLRHTFGSRLAIKGVPLHTIAELMGHDSPTMTKRYAHLSPKHLKEAVAQLCEPSDEKSVEREEPRGLAPQLAPEKMAIAQT